MSYKLPRPVKDYLIGKYKSGECYYLITREAYKTWYNQRVDVKHQVIRGTKGEPIATEYALARGANYTALELVNVSDAWREEIREQCKYLYDQLWPTKPVGKFDHIQPDQITFLDYEVYTIYFADDSDFYGPEVNIPGYVIDKEYSLTETLKKTAKLSNHSYTKHKPYKFDKLPQAFKDKFKLWRPELYKHFEDFYAKQVKTEPNPDQYYVLKNSNGKYYAVQRSAWFKGADLSFKDGQCYMWDNDYTSGAGGTFIGIAYRTEEHWTVNNKKFPQLSSEIKAELQKQNPERYKEWEDFYMKKYPNFQPIAGTGIFPQAPLIKRAEEIWERLSWNIDQITDAKDYVIVGSDGWGFMPKILFEDGYKQCRSWSCVSKVMDVDHDAIPLWLGNINKAPRLGSGITLKQIHEALRNSNQPLFDRFVKDCYPTISSKIIENVEALAKSIDRTEKEMYATVGIPEMKDNPLFTRELKSMYKRPDPMIPSNIMLVSSNDRHAPGWGFIDAMYFNSLGPDDDYSACNWADPNRFTSKRKISSITSKFLMSEGPSPKLEALQRQNPSLYKQVTESKTMHDLLGLNPQVGSDLDIDEKVLKASWEDTVAKIHQEKRRVPLDAADYFATRPIFDMGLIREMQEYSGRQPSPGLHMGKPAYIAAIDPYYSPEMKPSEILKRFQATGYLFNNSQTNKQQKNEKSIVCRKVKPIIRQQIIRGTAAQGSGSESPTTGRYFGNQQVSVIGKAPVRNCKISVSPKFTGNH